MGWRKTAFLTLVARYHHAVKLQVTHGLGACGLFQQAVQKFFTYVVALISAYGCAVLQCFHHDANRFFYYRKDNDKPRNTILGAPQIHTFPNLFAIYFNPYPYKHTLQAYTVLVLPNCKQDA